MYSAKTHSALFQSQVSHRLIQKMTRETEISLGIASDWLFAKDWCLSPKTLNQNKTTTTSLQSPQFILQ
jgi:hypothetical protein